MHRTDGFRLVVGKSLNSVDQSELRREEFDVKLYMIGSRIYSKILGCFNNIKKIQFDLFSFPFVLEWSSFYFLLL